MLCTTFYALYRYFSPYRYALAGGGERPKKFFHGRPNPLPAAMIRKEAYYAVSYMFTVDCVSWWKI